MAVNYKQCPKCGSKNSLEIIYGMPNHELFLEAEAGKVILGGCCITEDGPEYFCKDCKHEWNRGQAIDSAYSKIKTIKVSVGGYFDGYYNATIDLVNRKTAWSFNEGGLEETKNKSIRTKTAEKFLDQLKLVNLLNWKARYIDPVSAMALSGA